MVKVEMPDVNAEESAALDAVWDHIASGNLSINFDPEQPRDDSGRWAGGGVRVATLPHNDSAIESLRRQVQEFPAGPRRDEAIQALKPSKYDVVITMHHGDTLTGVASVWKTPDTAEEGMPPGQYIRVRNMATTRSGLGLKLFTEILKHAAGQGAGVYLSSLEGSGKFYRSLRMHEGAGATHYLTAEEVRGRVSDTTANYDPGQPRGEHGLWSREGGSAGTGLGSVMDKALQGKDEKFHRAISEASAGFSKVCRDRIAANLLFASFHKDPEALTVALGRDPSKRLCKGCFTSEGELHLCNNGDMTSPIACHELHHVIDLVPYGSHTYSDKPAWRDLWQKEIVAAPEKMSEHADVSASEGFAEFGRLIHTSGLTRGQVASKFPGCYRFFDSEGLL